MNFVLPAASANAGQTDALLIALTVMSGAVLALVFGLMFTYVIRYRAGNPKQRGEIAKKTFGIEIAWTAATLVVFFGLFIWGAEIYLQMFRPPANAMKIYVVGKQWMWKVEHLGGQREINALHIPVGRPVELLMTSEDVIHDFSVPAFRIKHDVLPGRYEMLWFTPDRIGTYHLFCTQLCGADHSSMVGAIYVMSQPDFQAWLSRNGTAEDLAAQGQAVFNRLGCGGCHQVVGGGGGGTVRAPSLVGLYGSPVPLSDGTTVIADDKYIRDSILEPKAQVVASYDPVMPSFAGQVTEEELIELIAYIKSLAGSS
jgi:cytochrome c oxidase subunit 2